MSLLVIGLNHRTAPVELRERLAFSSSRVEELLPQLKKNGGLDELVILSTCNRTEFYISAENSAAAITPLHQWLNCRPGFHRWNPIFIDAKKRRPSAIYSKSPQAWIPW